jgi:hypothetical protein
MIEDKVVAIALVFLILPLIAMWLRLSWNILKGKWED